MFRPRGGVGSPYAWLRALMERVVVRDVVWRVVVGFLLGGCLIFAQPNAFATQSVSLAWDPSPDTNVVGYKVYYGVANLTINENAGLQTVNLTGISSGATNEVQTLTITAVSGNTGLIPNPTVNYTSPGTTGTLTFTPVANANGSATITVTVNDGGASNNIVTRTFAVAVNSVNQLPTLNAISNLTINENAGLQTVSLT